MLLLLPIVVGCSAGAPAVKPPPEPVATLDTAAAGAVRATGRAAAIVALDPNDGRVLAHASVAGERGDPLLVAHVPASTFKVFAGLAGLESGAFDATTVEECTGRFAFAGKELTCSGVHGKETLHDAIVRSCNAFFYAAHVDHRALVGVARRFGFGERTGVSLPDESGRVESDARVAEIGRDPSSTVPLLDAIGHGEIEVTLLQLARAFAAVANGGRLVRLADRDGAVAPSTDVGAAPERLALLRDAMQDVVRAPEGTAHAVFAEDFAFAGKTGMADAPTRGDAGEEADRFFVAYAPPEHPEILVAARVERAATADAAQRAVRDVLDAWRRGRGRSSDRR
ncbi:MAG TPA: penicillin-binding transpeptidase domain-containing protein [Polyangiaceae bacterium]|nr:penicillin-binding transpeptidase domain-containing protein [Polyangiaceae bacterium]